MSEARLEVAVERWPIAGGFTISRGTKTEAVVVVASVTQGGVTGQGECVPYARYGETVEGVAELMRAQSAWLAAGGRRADLAAAMPAGAARNALDAALWALEARRAGRPVWAQAGLPEPQPTVTAYTLSLGDPGTMAAAAARAAERPLLKVKLGGDGDEERIRAVRAAAPGATLIVDANEAWSEANLDRHLAACAQAGVALIEQPLPAAADAVLEGFASPVPLCADESFHGRETLDTVARRYAYVNVKLDKTGGLTEAIEVANAARERGLGLMVGCMLGTSLAMAPAFLLAPWARFVDLDGPLLLARDRVPGFAFDGSLMQPAPAGLWG
ncbi:N-acetyl-D-Glu racemase DgcA [Rubrivivax gelatinosus]|uniref:Dipeptide epimerase n=1 Tax=Rubrivivax gelatinosus (strain NBRC 100245 / IL144) TaxID=983917 RepID=I0HSN0_RUBGI|nr:N-acetyl-D-Glu racemase DgcA [Rubrivivax gelatinosus]BAL96017.1 putative mandelate racemase/muconate lactonizing enzyme family protein [Rubrivivax gelatinosus IL144]